MNKKTKIVVLSVFGFLCLFALVAVIIIPQFSAYRIRSYNSSAINRHPSVDDILSKMELGNIAYNAPQEMNIEDKKDINLLLSIKTPIYDLKRQLKEEGEKIGSTIRISDRMEARLSGQNFSIVAITPEIQAISINENTEWKWEAVPKKGGKQYLHLTLSVFILVDGVSTPRTIRTFDSTIEVKVTPAQKVKIFLENNWQWLWAAILVPLVGWLWKKRKSPRGVCP